MSGLATFEDFLDGTPFCSKLRGNMGAEAIFNAIAREDNVQGMIEACGRGEPAVAHVMGEVELLAAPGGAGEELDLGSDIHRTHVGRMIKTILSRRGFVKIATRAIPTGCGQGLFKSGAVYRHP